MNVNTHQVRTMCGCKRGTTHSRLQIAAIVGGVRREAIHRVLGERAPGVQSGRPRTAKGMVSLRVPRPAIG